MDFIGLEGTSSDIIIDGGVCGKERPDRVFDFGDKIVVLECDEHQQRERQCVCEQSRMVNIGQSFGGTPVYFIRWNPDSYKTIDKKKQVPIKQRRTEVGKLLKCIEEGKYALPCGSLVYAFYMYYDKWDEFVNEEWHVLF